MSTYKLRYACARKIVAEGRAELGTTRWEKETSELEKACHQRLSGPLNPFEAQDSLSSNEDTACKFEDLSTTQDTELAVGDVPETTDSCSQIEEEICGIPVSTDSCSVSKRDSRSPARKHEEDIEEAGSRDDTAATSAESGTDGSAPSDDDSSERMKGKTESNVNSEEGTEQIVVEQGSTRIRGADEIGLPSDVEEPPEEEVFDQPTNETPSNASKIGPDIASIQITATVPEIKDVQSLLVRMGASEEATKLEEGESNVSIESGVEVHDSKSSKPPKVIYLLQSYMKPFPEEESEMDDEARQEEEAKKYGDKPEGMTRNATLVPLEETKSGVPDTATEANISKTERTAEKPEKGTGRFPERRELRSPEKRSKKSPDQRKQSESKSPGKRNMKRRPKNVVRRSKSEVVGFKTSPTNVLEKRTARPPERRIVQPKVSERTVAETRWSNGTQRQRFEMEPHRLEKKLPRKVDHSPDQRPKASKSFYRRKVERSLSSNVAQRSELEMWPKNKTKLPERASASTSRPAGARSSQPQVNLKQSGSGKVSQLPPEILLKTLYDKNITDSDKQNAMSTKPPQRTSTVKSRKGKRQQRIARSRSHSVARNDLRVAATKIPTEIEVKPIARLPPVRTRSRRPGSRSGASETCSMGSVFSPPTFFYVPSAQSAV